MFESSTTKYSSLVRNILARFKSLLCLALRKFKTLPKAIIFIPDDDIIKQAPIPLADAKDGEYHLIARYILEETRRLIISYKEHLPKKCKRDHFPHFIWVLPPVHKYFHNNRHRSLFSEAFEIEAENYADTCALRLKKVWDKNDGALYFQEQSRLSQGHHDYWKAIDAALRFWDKTLSEIMLKQQWKNPENATSYHAKIPRRNSSQHDSSCNIQSPRHHAPWKQSHSKNIYIWSRKKSPEMGDHRKLLAPPESPGYYRRY